MYYCVQNDVDACALVNCLPSFGLELGMLQNFCTTFCNDAEYKWCTRLCLQAEIGTHFTARHLMKLYLVFSSWQCFFILFPKGNKLGFERLRPTYLGS
jgi:hypothetical protein